MFCNINYFAFGWSAKYGDQRVCVSVCLSVSALISARLSQKPHVQTSRNSLYKLLVATGRGLVFLRRQCNVLSTSDFEDDVTF